jgi:hypothetical protein
VAEREGGVLAVKSVTGGSPTWWLRLAMAYPDGTISEEDGDVLVIDRKQAECFRLLLDRAAGAERGGTCADA